MYVQRFLRGAVLVGGAVLSSGCILPFIEAPPVPMAREDLNDVWIAPACQDAVWRLEVRPDGTGALSVALLEEIRGIPGQGHCDEFTQVKFDSSKGASVITVEDSEYPGTGNILRLSGSHKGLLLIGSVQWYSAKVKHAGDNWIMFVREANLHKGLKDASELAAKGPK